MSKCMWLVYDAEGLARNRDYVQMYEEICRPYEIEVQAVLDTDVKRRIENGETPVFVLVRTIQPQINAFFESQGILVFNSSHVSQICNDKGRTIEYLRDTIFSVPSLSLSCHNVEKIMSKTTEEVREWFWKQFSFSKFEKQERRVICEAEDFVVKAVNGHGGKQVFSLGKEREKIKNEIKTSDVVVQPMIPWKKESRDMRVYVVGTEVVAAVMRSSTRDFRANFSRGGAVKRVELDADQREIVRQIMEKFSFGMAGIDFIIDEHEQMIFNEIEDVVGARMLYQCAPDIDIAQRYIEFILKEKLQFL